MAQSLGQKMKAEEGGVMPCFLFHYRDVQESRTESNSQEWMKLSAGYFNKCISTVASLHSVGLKPLQCHTAVTCPSSCVTGLASPLIPDCFHLCHPSSCVYSLPLLLLPEYFFCHSLCPAPVQSCQCHVKFSNLESGHSLNSFVTRFDERTDCPEIKLA